MTTSGHRRQSPVDPPIGLIAGTGFADALAQAAPSQLTSRFGTVPARTGSWHVPVVFVPRHGPGHELPPHLIDYRAIIAGLAAAGCRDVIAVNVVGGISPDLTPGTLVRVSDFLDFTSGRAHTFHDGPGRGGVVHADVSRAYCPDLGAELTAAAEHLGEPLIDGAVYACFNGPRFESPAEIRMAATLGATVVGMTGVPEVTLAAEAGLRYAAISLVVNPAAGLTEEPIAEAELVAVLDRCRDRVLALIDRVLATRAEAAARAPGGAGDNNLSDSRARDEEPEDGGICSAAVCSSSPHV